MTTESIKDVAGNYNHATPYAISKRRKESDIWNLLNKIN